MAFDEAMADRVRELLGAHPGLSERKMFGGIGFMLEGKMAVGVIGDELVVRLDPEDAAEALGEAGVREFDFSGRPMKGWVFVSAAVSADPDALAGWVEAGASFAESLPPKSP